MASKPLPFRKQLPTVSRATYSKIMQALSAPKLHTYVIDDSQYLLAFEFFDKAKETGYEKFTNIALNFRNLIDFIATRTPPDCIVYLLHHIEELQGGKVKAKTIGKMLDEKLTVEGLFSIVLLCQTDGKEHKFITRSDGFTTVKSPMDMFPPEIDNDLKLVDSTIRDFYRLNQSKEATE